MSKYPETICFGLSASGSTMTGVLMTTKAAHFCIFANASGSILSLRAFTLCAPLSADDSSVRAASAT